MSPPKSVRIVSDGTADSTEIFDEHGKRMTTVSSLSVAIEDRDSVPTAKLEVLFPRVDVVAEATTTKVCPHCGHREEENSTGA